MKNIIKTPLFKIDLSLTEREKARQLINVIPTAVLAHSLFENEPYGYDLHSANKIKVFSRYSYKDCKKLKVNFLCSPYHPFFSFNETNETLFIRWNGYDNSGNLEILTPDLIKEIECKETGYRTVANGYIAQLDYTYKLEKGAIFKVGSKHFVYLGELQLPMGVVSLTANQMKK